MKQQTLEILFYFSYSQLFYIFIHVNRGVKDSKWLDDELDNDEPVVDGDDGDDAMECLGDSDGVEHRRFFQMNQRMVWNKDYMLNHSTLN